MQTQGSGTEGALTKDRDRDTAKWQDMGKMVRYRHSTLSAIIGCKQCPFNGTYDTDPWADRSGGVAVDKDSAESVAEHEKVVVKCLLK